MSRQQQLGETPQPVRGTLRLVLYVTAASPNSVKARRNLEAAIKDLPDDDYEIEIVDLTDDPELALRERIFLTPCLDYGRGHPLARVVGTLENRETLRAMLDQ